MKNLLDLLGALADEVHEGALAGGARVGRALAQVAVVADEAALAAVEGERDVAVRAVDALAARAAEHEARIAAAVEEDDGLLAARVRLLDGFEQLGREDFGLALRLERHAHVHDLRARHRASGDAAGELQVAVLALPRVLVRLKRGRRRAEDDDGALAVRAHDGRVAAVVVGRLLLPV